MDGSVYVQGHDASTLASHRSRSAEKQANYVLKKITPTSHMLDVGCGPGTITCDFAGLASHGSVVGVDYAESVVAAARTEARWRGLTNVIFQVATVHKLPFEDDTFDIVHCNAVLVHVPQAVAALKEMRRVCKAGGVVAVREPDWGTCVIHPYDPHLERWKSVHMQMKRDEHVESNAGRHLAVWASLAGFSPANVTLECDVLGYSGAEQIRWWGELYAQRVRADMGRRAVETSAASAEEVDQFAASWLEWSKTEGALWTLTHMHILAVK